MNKNLHIIRGTGYKIDETVVTIESVGDDDFVSVSPYSIDNPASRSIKIHKKYLQPFNGKDLTYELIIRKKKLGCEEEESYVSIDKCVRDVDTKILIDNIEFELSKILRME